MPESDPPDAFWRTLVADRGRDVKNPPVYYSRACKESFAKGGLSSGSVNTTNLINNERCSVIAQFCRRVQAVIWNRRFVITESQRLGLAGEEVQRADKVCILYGCSVPVILRYFRKSKEMVEFECEDELDVFMQKLMNLYTKYKDRKQATSRYRMINHDRWSAKMCHKWLLSPNGSGLWRDRVQSLQVLMVLKEDNKTKHLVCELDWEKKDSDQTHGKKSNIEKMDEKKTDGNIEDVERLEEKEVEGDEVNEEEVDGEKGKGEKVEREKLQEEQKDGDKAGEEKAEGKKKETDEVDGENMGKENSDGERTNRARPVSKMQWFQLVESKEFSIRDRSFRELSMRDLLWRKACKEWKEDKRKDTEAQSKELERIIEEHTKKKEIFQKEEKQFKKENLEITEAMKPKWEDLKARGEEFKTIDKDLKDRGKRIQTMLESFRREKKIKIDTRRRWFRRWRLLVRQSSPAHNTPCRDDNDRPLTEEEHLRNFKEKFRDVYLEPYKTDKDSPVLVEPNWELKDRDSLRVQEKWCYYKFFGECYIHGMMDGEAMAYQNGQNKSGKAIPAQVFELR